MKLALVVLLVACGSDKSPPPAPTNGPRPGTQLKVGPKPAEAGVVDGDPCARVADGVRAIWDKQVADAAAGPEREAAEQMRHKLAGRLERHCRDDGWSVDAIECIRGGNPCRGKLTPDQQHELDADKPD